MLKFELTYSKCMVVLLNLEPRQKESVERMLEYSARRYAAGKYTRVRQEA